jgi:CHASE3 domain sensor protein
MRSSSRRPGRRGIVLAALVAMGMQLGAFWMVCVLSGNLIQDNERQIAASAARSSALRVQLQKLTFGILSAHAAASDFLLSGNEKDLIPFRKANDEAPGIIGAIDRLCEGHVDELDRIHRISSLSDVAFDKLSDLRQYAPGSKTQTHLPDSALAAAHKSVQSLVTALAGFQESESRNLSQSLKAIGHSTAAGQRNLTDFGGALAIGAGILSSVILVAVVLKRERRLFSANAPEQEPVIDVAPPSVPDVVPVNPPAPPLIARSIRELAELAVAEVTGAATARAITFRAEIGPIWEYSVGASPKAVQEVMAGVLRVIVGSAAPGGPVTVSCIEQPGRIIRMRFQFYGKLVASQLPEILLAGARSLPGCAIRGTEAGVIWFEFPCVPALSDVAALQKATESNIGIASSA